MQKTLGHAHPVFHELASSKPARWALAGFRIARAVVFGIGFCVLYLAFVTALFVALACECEKV